MAALSYPESAVAVNDLLSDRAALNQLLAEGEGFEPSRRYDRLRDFQSRALGQAMRPFQNTRQHIGLAERVGFEPTEAQHLTAFRERHLQPLGHLSNRRSIASHGRTGRQNQGNDAIERPPGYPSSVSSVRLAGFEPAAFGSATQRSIP